MLGYYFILSSQKYFLHLAYSRNNKYIVIFKVKLALQNSSVKLSDLILILLDLFISENISLQVQSGLNNSDL